MHQPIKSIRDEVWDRTTLVELRCYEWYKDICDDISLPPTTIKEDRQRRVRRGEGGRRGEKTKKIR